MWYQKHSIALLGLNSFFFSHLMIQSQDRCQLLLWLPHPCSVWDIGSLNFLVFQIVRLMISISKLPGNCKHDGGFIPNSTRFLAPIKTFEVSKFLIKPTLISFLFLIRNHLQPGRTELRKDLPLAELFSPFLCFCVHSSRKTFMREQWFTFPTPLASSMLESVSIA